MLKACRGTVNANCVAPARRVALTPKRLAAYLQRNLDVRVDAARIDGVVCGDKRGAGRTARAYVCAYLHDGRAAATTSSDCDSPAPEATTSTTELHRPCTACPRARSGRKYELFFTYPLTTYSAPRRPFPTGGCPSFSTGQSKALSPCLCWFWFSAAAPRPDPLGQFLPHQEHHPTDCFTDLYDLLRLFSSTITPPTRQDALWLSPHHILTFFFPTN